MSVLLTILRELFWGFGRPRNPLQRRVRLASRGVTGVLVAYLALLCFPQVLFGHSYTHQNYTIYARTPLPPETGKVLARVDALLARSGLQTSQRHHRIFLCNDSALFTLFNPRPATRALGTSHATGNLFIHHGDLVDDLTWKHHDPRLVRSLSGLVAHEVTHNLVRDRLGWLGNMRLPEWKSEGYAEYIAMHGQEDYEHSLDDHRPDQLSTNYINDRYRRYLERVLVSVPERPIPFEALLDAR